MGGGSVSLMGFVFCACAFDSDSVYSTISYIIHMVQSCILRNKYNL